MGLMSHESSQLVRFCLLRPRLAESDADLILVQPLDWTPVAIKPGATLAMRTHLANRALNLTRLTADSGARPYYLEGVSTGSVAASLSCQRSESARHASSDLGT